MHSYMQTLTFDHGRLGTLGGIDQRTPTPSTMPGQIVGDAADIPGQ